MGNFKMKKIFIIFSVLFVLTSYGCGPGIINIKYSPDINKSYPLSSISPNTILIKVEDNRSESEKKMVGYYFDIMWGGQKPYTSKIPPPQIIYNVLKTEFENSGHKVYAEMERKDGLLFSVKLNRFFLDLRWNTKGLITGYVGEIIADLNVIELKSNKSFFSKKTHSTTRLDWRGHPDSKETYEVKFNEVIKQFIQDLLYDFSLIKALKQMETASSKGNVS